MLISIWVNLIGPAAQVPDGHDTRDHGHGGYYNNRFQRRGYIDYGTRGAFRRVTGARGGHTETCLILSHLTGPANSRTTTRISEQIVTYCPTECRSYCLDINILTKSNTPFPIATRHTLQ